MNVKMKAVMTPFPYSVELDDPIAKARGLMDEHRIRHLPVKDGCELVGLLTDRDLKLVLGPYLDIPTSTRCWCGMLACWRSSPLTWRRHSRRWRRRWLGGGLGRRW